MNKQKDKTKSFTNSNAKNAQQPRRSTYFDNTSQKGQGNADRQMLNIRFKRKDLKFQPGHYVTGQIKIQDVIDLKEVFDTYDSRGVGVILPTDLQLLLNQNDYHPNKQTLYKIVAEFDTEETGGISFGDFMKAMDTKPYLNETKKQIASIFKKYDRSNKGYLNLEDLRQINRQVKQNLDEETLRLMIEKSDSNADSKVSFQDFYSVMVKKNTY